MLYDLEDSISSMQWCNDGQCFIVTSCSQDNDYGVLEVHDVRMGWGATCSIEMNSPGKCCVSNGKYSKRRSGTRMEHYS